MLNKFNILVKDCGKTIFKYGPVNYDHILLIYFDCLQKYLSGFSVSRNHEIFLGNFILNIYSDAWIDEMIYNYKNIHYRNPNAPDAEYLITNIGQTRIKGHITIMLFHHSKTTELCN